MTKYLITGAGGFVARYLLELYDITDEGDTEILGLDQNFSPAGFEPRRCFYRFEKIDLTDRQRVEKLVAEFQPDRLIHLAATSSVATSWQDPAGCISNNVTILLNVFESIRDRAPKCRILSVGSSEVYDISNDDHPEPLTEESPLRPKNPYAVSRLAQENLARIYVESFGLDIVQTRSFSHTGPGQTERFAVPSFVRQLCEAKKSGSATARLRTGNVDVIRDFSDVRDVVRAYDLLLRKGKGGGVYNVSRGEGFSLRSIIQRAARLLDMEATIEVDPKLLRPHDPRIIIGRSDKLRKETDWMPMFSMEQTLGDMIRRLV